MANSAKIIEKIKASNRKRKGETRKNIFTNKYYGNALLFLLYSNEDTFTYSDIQNYIRQPTWTINLKKRLSQEGLIKHTKGGKGGGRQRFLFQPKKIRENFDKFFTEEVKKRVNDIAEISLLESKKIERKIKYAKKHSNKTHTVGQLREKHEGLKAFLFTYNLLQVPKDFQTTQGIKENLQKQVETINQFDIFEIIEEIKDTVDEVTSFKIGLKENIFRHLLDTHGGRLLQEKCHRSLQEVYKRMIIESALIYDGYLAGEETIPEEYIPFYKLCYIYYHFINFQNRRLDLKNNMEVKAQA